MQSNRFGLTSKAHHIWSSIFYGHFKTTFVLLDEVENSDTKSRVIDCNKKRIIFPLALQKSVENNLVIPIATSTLFLANQVNWDTRARPFPAFLVVARFPALSTACEVSPRSLPFARFCRPVIRFSHAFQRFIRNAFPSVPPIKGCPALATGQKFLKRVLSG